MAKVLWHGLDKPTAEVSLKRTYLPADPNARIEKRSDGYVIYADKMIAMIPKVVKK